MYRTGMLKTTKHQLKKKIKEHLNQRRHNVLWIGKLTIVKKSILPKLIYRLNTIPVKISARLFI